MLCGAPLLLLVGFTSLTGTGRQTAVARPNSELVSGRSVGREAKYEEAGLALNVYANQLLELDARFSRLMRKDPLTSPAGLARVREEIKAQEYALGHLLDSLDGRRKELSPLIRSFRSLLDGHRILSGFQTDQQRPDSVPALSSLP